jgi:hypothetical protein
VRKLGDQSFAPNDVLPTFRDIACVDIVCAKAICVGRRVMSCRGVSLDVSDLFGGAD